MLDILTGQQESLSPGQLERLLLETVQDAYRSGSRLTYTPEQQCAIISLAVRKPIEFGFPVENGTHWELAAAANMTDLAPAESHGRQSLEFLLTVT